MSDIDVSGKDEPSFIGGIVGFADESMQIDVNNSYYRNSVESSNNYGVIKTDSEMKTQQFVDLLNDGDGPFMMDLNGYYNYGYPILSWYYYNFYSIDANNVNNTIAIYPNPVSDYIYIELSDNSICTAIEIYSLDGRLVKSQTNNLSTIDISSLPMGVYIVKIRMADGKEFSERIVKE